jgi:23S rRNA (pseudouridine1915-N3)-methyltransferase
MKVTLFNMGKTEARYLQLGIDEYSQRIRHFIDFSIIDLPGIKSGKNVSQELIRRKEGETILHATSRINTIILLDEKGEEYTSRAFAEYLNALMNQGAKQVAFVSGGAYGFSEEVRKHASHQLSLSRMTFTHQLARLIFMEQLYRALTLIKGIPYHND